MEQTVEFVLRLLLAGVLGAVVGLEREYRAKEAGYRTHFLVALGSALLMIISQHGFGAVLGSEGVGLDPSRIAAQVVTGIGFIGAGTIILNKYVVRGLTTAAGVWATSAIGLAVGSGMYLLAVSATVLTLAGLELLSIFFKSIGLRSSIVEMTLNDKTSLPLLFNFLNENDFVVVSYKMEELKNDNCNVALVIKARRMDSEGILLAKLSSFEYGVVHRLE